MVLVNEDHIFRSIEINKLLLTYLPCILINFSLSSFVLYFYYLWCKYNIVIVLYCINQGSVFTFQVTLKKTLTQIREEIIRLASLGDDLELLIGSEDTVDEVDSLILFHLA